MLLSYKKTFRYQRQPPISIISVVNWPFSTRTLMSMVKSVLIVSPIYKEYLGLTVTGCGNLFLLGIQKIENFEPRGIFCKIAENCIRLHVRELHLWCLHSTVVVQTAEYRPQRTFGDTVLLYRFVEKCLKKPVFEHFMGLFDHQPPLRRYNLIKLFLHILVLLIIFFSPSCR